MTSSVAAPLDGHTSRRAGHKACRPGKPEHGSAWQRAVRRPAGCCGLPRAAEGRPRKEGGLLPVRRSLSFPELHGAPPPSSPSRASFAIFPHLSPLRARHRLTHRLLQSPTRGERRWAPAGPGPAAYLAALPHALRRAPPPSGARRAAAAPCPAGRGRREGRGGAGRAWRRPGPL